MVEQPDAAVAELPLADLRAWVGRLSAHATAGTTAADDRVAVIGLLEDLRAAAAAQAAEVAALAAEARMAVEVDIATVDHPGIGRARRREHARRRMVAAVAKARRISPAQAGPYVAFAEHARADLPAVFAQFATGQVSERRALSVFTATTPLDAEQRRAVDAIVAPKLPGLGDTRVDQAARAAVYHVDPAGVVQRNAYAVTGRRVGVRPAPDCMAFVTTLTTMPTAVAFRAQLEKDAKAARAAGDPRTLGQLMADIAMARVLDPTVTMTATPTAADPPQTTGTTGTATTGTWPAADATGRPVPPDGAAFSGPVAVQLLITDRSLAGGNEPARFANGDPYPAPLARDLALETTAAARTVRRLFTDPAGRIVTAETTSRNFTPAMRELVTLRDGTCTTPWCNASIIDIDHHDPATHGGPTSTTNARGLCRWCNVTKADRAPDDPPAPPPPQAPAPGHPGSALERQFRRHLARRTPPQRRRVHAVIELHVERC